MGVIKIEKLTKDYGNHKGVFNITFAVEKGEIFGFLGPNGAGKTTTIRNLMGFVNHDSGNCTIDGQVCRSARDRIQKNVGYLPGEITLMDNMDGMSFIRFMADMRGLKDLRKAKALIERFELNPKGKIKKMSKGMKQKIGIVCAFMHDPEILILDEPTSGLDPLMQNIFIEMLLEEKAKGKTILMSSHIFEEVEKTCDRVGIIREGKLVAVKDIHELKSELKNRYYIDFASSAEKERFKKEDVYVVQEYTHSVIVEIHKDLHSLLCILPQYEVTKVDMQNLNLERLFMNYYGGKQHD
ncbi:MAG: ABC transporter ATP-binding protein [Breznakia sp.]